MENKALIVGVLSSAREGSNSAVLVREALKGAAEKGAEAQELFLPSYNLGFCTGCLTCMKTGKCRMSDGFNELRERLYEADGIIWGAPTYAAAPNAIMKNFIDRLGMFEMSTSSLGGAYMAGISSASSAGAARKVARDLARFGIGGTFRRSYSVGFLGAGFQGGRTAKDDRTLLARARKLGSKLAESIRISRSYPLQGLPMRILNALVLRPVFSDYIRKNRDGDARLLYECLHSRDLIR